ncbi:cell division protein FtsQ/DivIB [Patescibacteria group bacterium]
MVFDFLGKQGRGRGKRSYFKKRRSFFGKKQSFKNPKIYSRTPKQETFFVFPLKSIAWMILLLAIVAITAFVLFSPLFVIDDITVVGNYHLSPEEVKEATEEILLENSSFIFPVGHIFFLNKDDLRYDLQKKLPLVNEVSFDRQLPDVFKVKVKERTPAFVWKSKNKYYYIDPDGYAYLELKKNEVKSTNLTVLEDRANVRVDLGGKVVTSSFVDFVNNLVVNFTPKTKVKIEEIILPETTLEIRVQTNEGWQAYFDTTRSAKVQLNRLSLALKQITKPREQLEYIDLRLNDRLFYK